MRGHLVTHAWDPKDWVWSSMNQRIYKPTSHPELTHAQPWCMHTLFILSMFYPFRQHSNLYYFVIFTWLNSSPYLGIAWVAIYKHINIILSSTSLSILYIDLGLELHAMNLHKIVTLFTLINNHIPGSKLGVFHLLSYLTQIKS